MASFDAFSRVLNGDGLVGDCLWLDGSVDIGKLVVGS